MVSPPERLKADLPDRVVGGGVHEEHNQEHHVTGEPARLSIMDRPRSLAPDLGTLNVDKVDVYQTRQILIS